MSAALSRLQVDDGRIRVVRYDMAPGDTIAWHRHPHDYLVVPLTDGSFDAVGAEGSSHHRVTAGEPYRRSAGVEHELVNGEQSYSFIEIEFLNP